MLNFVRIREDAPVGAVLPEMRGLDYLWHQHTFRQAHPGSAHHDTSAIYLRYPPLGTITVHDVFNELEAQMTPAADALPAACHLAFWAQEVLGVTKLGRVMLVNLRAGGSIDPHVDEGAYADCYARFHVCVSAQPGVVFRCGGEEVEMRPGELWWFNHKRKHWVENRSSADRVHLIVDAVAPRYRVEREAA